MKTKLMKQIIICLLTGFLAAFPWPCSSAPLFKCAITDLGTLGGQSSMAYGVNERGEVAGKSRNAKGDLKSFYWDSVTGMVEIGPGKALGINDNGRVVGNFHKHTDDAFVWDGIEGLSLLYKGDFLFATANGIGNSGKIVGYARKFNDIGGTRAILWDPLMDTLTTLEGFEGPNYAFAINSMEQVVGNSGVPSRAFIWRHDGVMMDLGTLNDEGWRYYATDVNDRGQVVGYAKTDADAYVAYIWNEGLGMQELLGEGESLALAINRQGHVVGAQGTLIGLEGKAYLWKNGERMDLNEMIRADSGWDLREARGITDAGLICGTGLINGELHAFLLTPVSFLTPDIKANGADGPVTVSSGETVSISVTLDPGSHSGQNADWWIAARTPFDPPGDWYSYVHASGWMPGIQRCAETGLFALTGFEVFHTALPPGDYTFYFALDDPDGEATGPWWGMDAVQVRVDP